MNIQWYPGHMTKARRMMQEDIKLIDIVIELVDARLPLASKNPDIDDLAKGKARLILLNKSDMADPKYTKLWEGYFKAKGFFVLQINARTGAGMKAVTGVVNEACKEKIERDRRRGIKNRPIRAMIAVITVTPMTLSPTNFINLLMITSNIPASVMIPKNSTENTNSAAVEPVLPKPPLISLPTSSML